MSGIARRVMAGFYRDAAGDAERLPWHRETPSGMLVDAVAECQRGARALDVGCGAGVFSVWLAEHGMAVTGIDLFQEAIAMAEARAARSSVKVELARVDLFAFRPDRPFALVYDSGCLHSLVGGDVPTYKRSLLSWLVPGGQFVLEHWGKRHALDWRPIGPRRRSRATIERAFAPELALIEAETSDFAAPLPFGPTVRGMAYRFRRTPELA